MALSCRVPAYAVTIARGGSKRIQRKNLQRFCNLPLVEWTAVQIQTAAELDGAIMVTDDDDIASIAASHGLTVVMQPNSECEYGAIGGMIASARAGEYLDHLGVKSAIMCTMLPTSPLRKPGELDAVIRMYRDLCIPEGQHGLGASAPIRHPGILYETDPGKALGLVSACAPRYLTYSMLYGVGPLDDWIAPYDGDYSLDNILRIARRKSDIPAGAYVPVRYFPVEPWQCHDIDEWYEFWVAAEAMERMILKGRGEEIYGRARLGVT